MPCHRSVRGLHVLAQAPADDPLDCQGGQGEEQRRPADRPRHDDGQGHRGNGGRSQAQPHGRGGPFTDRQAGEGIRAHRRRHILTEDGQVLAQVEARRQYLHRRLPRAHGLDIGWRQQPGGQCALAHARSRLAQELVQRALAEEVEVVGIGMVGIVEAGSGASGPRPLPVEAHEPALIVRGASLRPPAVPSDPFMDDKQGHEGRGRHHEPPCREPARAEREPRDQCRRQCGAKPAREMCSSRRLASAARSRYSASRRRYSPCGAVSRSVMGGIQCSLSRAGSGRSRVRQSGEPKVRQRVARLGMDRTDRSRAERCR